jgi:hypothetical protein
MASVKIEADINLDNISASKLLNYVTKDALIAFVTPIKYSEVEQRLRVSLNKSKVNLKDIKKYLATRVDYIASLRRSPTGSEAFAKYSAAVNRLREIDRTKATATRRVMAEPRRRFQGCLAAQLKPAQYEHCLDNFDDQAYDSIGLVPSSLTQRVYDKGDTATRNVLEQKITSKTGTFSDLPNGLRSYISKNPDQFKDYFEQRRHEVGLLKAVLRNLSNDDKQKLQTYYRQHGTLEPEKFSDIIATQSSSSSKRPRSALETPKKGGSSTSRFRLENKIDTSDHFFGDDDILGGKLYDQSIDDILQ